MVDTSSSPKRSNASPRQRDCNGSLKRFLQRSYALDYVAIVSLLVLDILIFLFVDPFHRLFSLDDLAIQYPHAEHERVPPGWLLAYAGGVPLLVITIWAIISRPAGHKARVTYLGLLLSVFLTGFVTDVVKNTVGRPRPDLLSRCKPKNGTPQHALSNIDVCTEQGQYILQEGWRSFPSGHSSYSFSGLGYLALFLAAQTHAWRSPSTPLPLSLLPLVPLLAALLIAISRTEDYRHDVWDVTAGSFLGMSIALYSYRRYYPSLRSQHCETPWPCPGVATTLAMKNRRGKDEEVGLAQAQDESDDEAVVERQGLESGLRRSGSGRRAV